MSPRTGRPKVENPKNESVKIRMNQTDHEKLMQYCEKNNISRTEAIRRGLDLLLNKK